MVPKGAKKKKKVGKRLTEVVKRPRKVVLGLLTQPSAQLAILRQERERLRNLVLSVVGLARHGALEVRSREREVDERLFRIELVRTKEIDWQPKGRMDANKGSSEELHGQSPESWGEGLTDRVLITCRVDEQEAETREIDRVQNSRFPGQGPARIRSSLVVFVLAVAVAVRTVVSGSVAFPACRRTSRDGAAGKSLSPFRDTLVSSVRFLSRHVDKLPQVSTQELLQPVLIERDRGIVPFRHER